LAELPPCGIYRTGRALGDAVPAGRLVYFHNHGDPGAGVYLPNTWNQNRAQWNQGGTPIPDPEWAKSLEPLAAEGLYRVREQFHCCAKKCRLFEPDLLIQLGYNGNAEPLVFEPELTATGLVFPERGSAIDRGNLTKLALLKVAESRAPVSGGGAGGMMH
jgi:hypothetical protein